VKELQDIHRLLKAGTGPLALATLVRVEGSSYRRPGARLLTDGHRVLRGSLSGGCLEGEVLGRAREVLADGAPRLLAYDLRGDADLVWGSGMGCEGVLTVRVERLSGVPPWMATVMAEWEVRRSVRLALSSGADEAPRILAEAEHSPGAVEELPPPLALWLWGGDEDTRLLVDLAKGLGWCVGVVDHRPAFVTRERFPSADTLQAGHPAQVVPALPLDARSGAVLLTHNYLKDQETLRHLLATSVGYVGLMGSRARCARMVAGLGITDPRLRAPVGLDLGSRAPEAVALAILAEVQAALLGGSGRPLSEAR
jgi:xanthine dehydrogenase accessory factor